MSVSKATLTTAKMMVTTSALLSRLLIWRFVGRNVVPPGRNRFRFPWNRST
jgi:hypothetical protein